MSIIAVVGTGYVGLTTAVCLADIGHEVTGVDVDASKIAALRRGEPTFQEPGVGALLQQGLASGRLRFATDYADVIPACEFVFITVPTPMATAGEADLAFVREAAQAIGECLTAPVTIVNKSTVPAGTGEMIARIVSETRRRDVPFHVVSNPEFLRQGTAVHDFMHPDRLVFGAHDRAAAEAVAALFAGAVSAPVVITDLASAEVAKYASNAYLATRIAFINEIARICEPLGADIKVVSHIMGLDHRIGPLLLEAGLGYGGSCFPKDVRALAHVAENLGYHPELLDIVIKTNLDQRKAVVNKLNEVLGGLRHQTVGVLGLAFKPNTDDVRDAPSLDVIQDLLERGAQVRAYDPLAMPRARQQLNSVVEFCSDSYSVATRADALVIITEWDEFRELDLSRVKALMRRPVVVDGRNIYDPRRMRELGFIYRGVGRS
jgi:UDPglucose 6-dehydrogenase